MMNINNLVLKGPQYEDEIEIFIEGDAGDADYVSRLTFINLEYFDEHFPILQKMIKNVGKSVRWDTGLSEDEIDIMEEASLIPYGTRDGDQMNRLTYLKVYFLSKTDNIRYEVEL